MPKDHKSPIVYLLAEVDVAAAPADGKDLPRNFSGVANSGKPFNYYGEMVVVDLSDITYKDNVPALLLHDRAQRAGFGALSVSNNQLLMNGKLLNNIYGREVADESDAGFPWQMSVHVNANSIHELGQNETATVNGAEVTGPLVILKNCSVSEVSFTPTGVDSETNAVALGDDGNPQSITGQPNTQKDKNMELEEALAALAAKEKENEELKAEKAALEAKVEKAEAEAKAADIDAQLSQAGFVKNESGEGWQGIGAATVNMLLSASPEDAKSMIGDLRAPSKQDNVPDYLLGEEHPPIAGGQGRQLSSNPMLANAEARAAEKKNYI